VPSTTATAIALNATSNETRVPCTRPAAMSLPIMSVPRGNAASAKGAVKGLPASSKGSAG